MKLKHIFIGGLALLSSIGYANNTYGQNKKHASIEVKLTDPAKLAMNNPDVMMELYHTAKSYEETGELDKHLKLANQILPHFADKGKYDLEQGIDNFLKLTDHSVPEEKRKNICDNVGLDYKKIDEMYNTMKMEPHNTYIPANTELKKMK